MAGGTWTSQNQQRPGAYINVRSSGGVGQSTAETGIASLPLSVNWGPESAIIAVDGSTNIYNIFGTDLADQQLAPLREALKRAATVLVYRVSKGTKATATAAPLTATAKHGGTRGNDLKVEVKASLAQPGKMDVITFLGTNQVDIQTVADSKDLKANEFVVFTGTGKPVATAGTSLAGATDTAATSGDYGAYFEALQLHDFNTIALPVADEAIKILGVNFAKRMRNEEGKKCQVVVANYNADSEAVINVKNGVILADGKTVDAALATAWVAGATAAAAMNESLTYSAYDGAVDVSERYTSTQIKDALRAGEFVFVEKRGAAVVEQDINSLVTFTPEKNQGFSKNRVMRVLDGVANDSKQTFEDNYIGKITNNVDGRELFKADRIEYFNGLQTIGAIEVFDSEELTIAAGATKDSVVMNVAIQPTDAMEKLYMTVEVQ